MALLVRDLHQESLLVIKVCCAVHNWSIKCYNQRREAGIESVLTTNSKFAFQFNLWSHFIQQDYDSQSCC